MKRKKFAIWMLKYFFLKFAYKFVILVYSRITNIIFFLLETIFLLKKTSLQKKTNKYLVRILENSEIVGCSKLFVAAFSLCVCCFLYVTYGMYAQYVYLYEKKQMPEKQNIYFINKF